MSAIARWTTGILLLAGLAAGLAWLVWQLRSPFRVSLAANVYRGVVLGLIEHIEAEEKWPTSWEDLEGTSAQAFREHAVIDFDATLRSVADHGDLREVRLRDTRFESWARQHQALLIKTLLERIEACLAAPDRLERRPSDSP